MKTKIMILAVLSALLIGCSTGEMNVKSKNGDGYTKADTETAVSEVIYEYKQWCVSRVHDSALAADTKYYEMLEARNRANPSEFESVQVSEQWRMATESIVMSNPAFKTPGAQILSEGMGVCDNESNYFDYKLQKVKSRAAIISTLTNGLSGVIMKALPIAGGVAIAKELKDGFGANVNAGGDVYQSNGSGSLAVTEGIPANPVTINTATE